MPALVVAIRPLPFPSKTALASKADQPVPPTETDRVDEEVRSVPEVQTAGRPAEPEPVRDEEPPPTHVPLIAKQPAVRFMPLANVEEALRYATSSAVFKTVVAMSPTPSPLTLNLKSGAADVEVAIEKA